MESKEWLESQASEVADKHLFDEQEIKKNIIRIAKSYHLKKEKEAEESNPMSFDPDIPLEVRKAWADWLQYKKSLHRFRYKTLKSEKTAFERAWRKAMFSEVIFCDAVEDSMANGYKGLIVKVNDKAQEKEQYLDKANRIYADVLNTNQKELGDGTY